MSFRTMALQLHGKSATGIEVPPAVVATVTGYAYRTTVAARGEVFPIPFSREHQAPSGIGAGMTSRSRSKKAETRARRVDKSVAALREGCKQHGCPCWLTAG